MRDHSDTLDVIHLIRINRDFVLGTSERLMYAAGIVNFIENHSGRRFSTTTP